MNWEAIGAVGEIAGAAVVFATLIYVAKQIQQTNQGAQATVESQMGSWWSSHNREMIHSPEMIEIIEQGFNDMQSLSDADRRRFSWWLASLFYMFDVLYLQYQRGVLTDKSWSVNEMSIVGFLRNRSVSIWWESGFFQASPDFAKHIEMLRKDDKGIDWNWVDIARVFDQV